MDLDDLAVIAGKERAARPPVDFRVCSATGCLSAGARDIGEALSRAVEEQGLGGRARILEVGCMRLCCEGPLVRADAEGAPPALFGRVTPERVREIASAVRTGTDASPSTDTGTGTKTHPSATNGVRRIDLQAPFFARQRPIVLENCGVIEPSRIESYIAAGGYQPLYQALREMSPERVVEEITRSGLRGRGGAGYPTGLKWATVAKMPPGQKYVVCNADEGDPGAFMDRSVLEGDPHRVLEGMAIAAYAVGANQGFIYARGEYPAALSRLEEAIQQSKRFGLLGSGIFDSPFDFRVDLRIGAGAFVCGEETALIHSIEGQRGIPRPRPPYPAESGLWGCPTLINNVETFANIPAIIREGADWFAGIGNERSKGTKVFALAGKIRNTGLVEVPMGIPLREIVEDIGGGSPDGSRVKAVQTGGPSGGCIPAERFDTPVDYEALKALGSIMGSGGMIVMDEEDDMVGLARYFMEFCMEESCGKCIPCRAGTVQMFRLLDRIDRGVGTAADLQRLEELGEMVQRMSLCGLGQAAPNPVRSTLTFFRHEYESRLVGSNGAARPRASGPNLDPR